MAEDFFTTFRGDFLSGMSFTSFVDKWEPRIREWREKAEMTTVAFRTRDAAIKRALKTEGSLEAVKTILDEEEKAEPTPSINVRKLIVKLRAAAEGVGISTKPREEST